jgi:hypothetical protein
MHPRASRETAGPDLPSCVSLIGFSVTLAEAQSGLRLRAGWPGARSAGARHALILALSARPGKLAFCFARRSALSLPAF